MRVFTVSVFFLSFFFLRTSIHRRVQLRRHAADWSVFYEWPPLWAISLAAMALKAPIETSIDLLPSKFTSSKKKEEKSRKNRFQLDKTLVTTMKRKRNGSRPFYFFFNNHANQSQSRLSRRMSRKDNPTAPEEIKSIQHARVIPLSLIFDRVENKLRGYFLCSGLKSKSILDVQGCKTR